MNVAVNGKVCVTTGHYCDLRGILIKPAFGLFFRALLLQL